MPAENQTLRVSHQTRRVSLWETPLAGVLVTLDGTATATTDESGRFAFYNVPAGAHTVAASLPAGLTAAIPAILTEEGRGAAVGIAATPDPPDAPFRVFLPLAIR